ncbi:MAG: acyltransferase [Akkermansia sp.]|nr:acyltransferase [Akkermansia sp.]
MREKWPDLLRGILILLLVLTHNLTGNAKIHYLYGPYYMSAFFFLSGYFFKGADMSPGDFVLKKMRGVVIPYLLVGGTCFWIGEAYREYVMGIHQWAHWEAFFREYILEGHYFWFVNCLICLQLLQYITVKLCGARDGLLLGVSSLVSLFALYYLTYVERISLPWHSHVACVMLWSINLGYVARKRNWISRLADWRVVLTSAALYLPVWAYAVFALHLPPVSDVWGAYYNAAVYVLLLHFGMVFSLAVAQKMKPVNFLLLLGRNTLCIYFIHYLFTWVMQNSVAQWYEEACAMLDMPGLICLRGVFVRIPAIVFGIAAGVAVSEGLRRYAPWVLGARKKA